MRIRILNDKHTLGQQAPQHAAESLRTTLREKVEARNGVATGAWQFEFLLELASTGCLLIANEGKSEIRHGAAIT